MCGPAGSGKSTVARRLEADGYARVSFDEHAWGLGFTSHPLAPAQSARVDAEVRAAVLGLVRSGRDVVVDSSFWSRAARDAYRALLAPEGVLPVTLYVRTPPAVLLERVAARGNTGPHDVALTPGVVEGFVAGFEVPTPDEGPLRVVAGE
ncbi:AAA family ATPase [Cellulomonas massiliensis]|uniref:AAA family ATPase n=1 Tax=Cellulomonas massiliensis TaxID=1465811 RepID=UPI0005914070|nr:ATP-binding protein [Cellulomonas massiliensis]